MAKTYTIAITICSLFLLLSGCGHSASSPPEYKQQQLLADEASISDHLENLAAQQPQVKNAQCIVIANTAIIGIDVDGTLERAKVDTVKYAVAETLHNDPFGKNAVVLADPDIVGRLREYRQSMKNGRPIAGLAEEMADIIGRIMPQLSQETRPSRHELQQQQLQENKSGTPAKKPR